MCGEGEDRLSAVPASCLAALYELCARDSLQAAVTALYAKLLVIMGQAITGTGQSLAMLQTRGGMWRNSAFEPYSLI